MDKLLEYLALAGAGIALYVVYENNSAAVRQVVSNIKSNIVPVSTTAPSPDTSRMYCPKGMYLDQTDGIYHCHDAHGTRELRSPSAGVPLEAAFYDASITPELYPSTIKKSVNPQIKKKDKKLAQIPDDHQVHAQVECSDNLKCDSNCYKDGKLYKIVCSEKEKESLYPHKTKKKTTHNHPIQPPPSLTVPPNFPSAVTVTPSLDTSSPPPPLTPGGIANPIDETPYPEDDTQTTTSVTDEGPEQDIGPLIKEPTKQPEIGPTTKEPHKQPQIGPITKEPHRQPQIGAPMPTQPGKPVGKSSPTQNTGFTNGCGRSENRDPYISCRAGIGTMSGGKPTKEAGNQTRSVESLLSDKNHFFAVYDFNIDPSAHVVSGHPQDVQVTGGYNGSNTKEPAVGVSIGIEVDGTPYVAKEDESHHNWGKLCKGSQCGGVGKVPNLGTKFSLVWAADKDGSTATYRGYIKTGGKEYLIAKISPGIDFTRQNTYIRGRTNQLGNTCPTGLLYNGTYIPSKKGFTYSGPEGFMLEGEGYF